MSDLGRTYTIAFSAELGAGTPPDEVRSAGYARLGEDGFARTLAGAVWAMRQMEAVWDGASFAGDDPAEMAARLLILLADRELSPDGFWHFRDEKDAENQGYAERLARLKTLLVAAREFVALTGGKPA